jgi:hypothetical protein
LLGPSVSVSRSSTISYSLRAGLRGVRFPTDGFSIASEGANPSKVPTICLVKVEDEGTCKREVEELCSGWWSLGSLEVDGKSIAFDDEPTGIDSNSSVKSGIRSMLSKSGIGCGDVSGELDNKWLAKERSGVGRRGSSLSLREVDAPYRDVISL